MRKKLVTIGSSMGLIIDKPILDLLKISPETEMEMETDGENLILRPVRFVSMEQGMATYREIAARHRRSLEKLAK
jgi:antitoxin component of MazEF toxin-antitoxin module